MSEAGLQVQERPQVIECARCGKTVFTFTMEELGRDGASYQSKMRNAVDEHDAKYHGKPRRPTP